MRRKPGTLVLLERAILQTAVSLERRGTSEFHGFAIASRLRDDQGARRLLAHGTLYKALDRMREAGLITSRWESPEIAEEQGRPRRRLYTVTAKGLKMLAAAQAAEPMTLAQLRVRLAGP